MPGQMPARLREASKLGFKTAVIPRALRSAHNSSSDDRWPKGLEIIEARSIQQALDAALLAESQPVPKGRKVA
jgi:DNA repair protein RadA/Sms